MGRGLAAFRVASSRNRLASRGLPRCWASRVGPPLGSSSSSRRAFSAVPSMTDMPTTDATFRYRTFEWETSCGERHDYEYIVAQQPAGGSTARNALLAVEEGLPRPPSGWSVVLLPSVSLFCSGKEEMRPLATVLSQRGHRCYVLEWPGWTSDVQTNFSLVQCKVEELGNEYEDFWCQLLEHVVRAEASEEASGSSRLCLVGAGNSAVYALRALRALQAWRHPDATDDPALARAFSSLVMIAPTWQTPPHGMAAYLSAPRASRWLGSWLNSDSRVGRWFRNMHYSRRRLRKHFAHRGAPDQEADRLLAVASWLFQRPRPYLQTDAAALYGLLDPPGAISAEELAEELWESSTKLSHGSLVLLSGTDERASSGAAGSPWAALAELLSARRDGATVECSHVAIPSPLPHEVAPSQVVFALDSWLSRAASPTDAGASAS